MKKRRNIEGKQVAQETRMEWYHLVLEEVDESVLHVVWFDVLSLLNSRKRN